MASQDRHFVKFPESKKDKAPDYYLRRANAGNPIRSSIPDALAQGRSDVHAAATSAANSIGLSTSVEQGLAEKLTAAQT
jgi:hypothetical protein